LVLSGFEKIILLLCNADRKPSPIYKLTSNGLLLDYFLEKYEGYKIMHNSMMPQFPLSQNDLTDLVAYLSTLKRKEQLSIK
jgi:hypothetical protein